MTLAADIQRFMVRSAQRAAAWVRKVRSQPGWVMRAAATAFLIVIAVPIVLLVMFALLVGIAVFAVLATANNPGLARPSASAASRWPRERARDSASRRMNAGRSHCPIQS